MEIPKKIYIDGPTSEFDNHWSIYQNNDSIEYTRTDTFMDKALFSTRKKAEDAVKWINANIEIVEL